jgi:hypothetical protein
LIRKQAAYHATLGQIKAAQAKKQLLAMGQFTELFQESWCFPAIHVTDSSRCHKTKSFPLIVRFVHDAIHHLNHAARLAHDGCIPGELYAVCSRLQEMLMLKAAFDEQLADQPKVRPESAASTLNASERTQTSTDVQDSVDWDVEGKHYCSFGDRFAQRRLRLSALVVSQSPILEKRNTKAIDIFVGDIPEGRYYRCTTLFLASQRGCPRFWYLPDAK